MLYTFVSDNCVPFLTRYLAAGERYGLDGTIVADRPMIEFLDQTTDPPQFVSRYHAETLRDDARRPSHRGGLCLDGGNREWDISAENLAGVLRAFFVLPNRGVIIQYDDPAAQRPYAVYCRGAAQARLPTYLTAYTYACTLACLTA
jgi:hypothetical protein